MIKLHGDCFLIGFKDSTKANKVPKYVRTVLVEDGTGDLWMSPCFAGMSESTAFLCCSADGERYATMRGHIYVRADWLAQERPNAREAIARLKANRWGDVP